MQQRVVGCQERGGRGGRHGGGRGGVQGGVGRVGVQGAGQPLVRHQVVPTHTYPTCTGGRQISITDGKELNECNQRSN